jgi:hypothetical protein
MNEILSRKILKYGFTEKLKNLFKKCCKKLNKINTTGKSFRVNSKIFNKAK